MVVMTQAGMVMSRMIRMPQPVSLIFFITGFRRSGKYHTDLAVQVNDNVKAHHPQQLALPPAQVLLETRNPTLMLRKVASTIPFVKEVILAHHVEHGFRGLVLVIFELIHEAGQPAPLHITRLTWRRKP